VAGTGADDRAVHTLRTGSVHTRWHHALGQGHVALVGDAAHAMLPDLGQGLAMGLEDAVVLADQLRDGIDGPRLEAWQTRRFDRVKHMARLSSLAAGLGHARAPALVREAFLQGPFAATSLAVFHQLLDEDALGAPRS